MLFPFKALEAGQSDWPAIIDLGGLLPFKGLDAGWPLLTWEVFFIGTWDVVFGVFLFIYYGIE